MNIIKKIKQAISKSLLVGAANQMFTIVDPIEKHAEYIRLASKPVNHHSFFSTALPIGSRRGCPVMRTRNSLYPNRPEQ